MAGWGLLAATPQIPRQHWTGDLRKEMDRGTRVGWGPDHYEEIQNAKRPEARQHGCWEHQEACLEVLPAEDRALPYRRIPALDDIPPDAPVLVVPAPQADKRAPLKGVPEVEKTAESAVEGGVERDREGEGETKSLRALRGAGD